MSVPCGTEAERPLAPAGQAVLECARWPYGSRSIEGDAAMSYSPDLSVLAIQDYRDMLKHKDLLPGRRLLLEGLDGHFASIADRGIADVAALQRALSTPKKRAAFAATTGIPDEYLVLLRREIGGLPAQGPAARGSRRHRCRDLPAAGRCGHQDERGSLRGVSIRRSRGFAARAGGRAVRSVRPGPHQTASGPSRPGYSSRRGYGSCRAVGRRERLRHAGAIARRQCGGRLLCRQPRVGKDMQFCIDSARMLVAYAR